MATQPLVDDAPAEAALSESQFVVPSLHCAGCIAKVERGLMPVEGVDAARVNLSAKQVTVRHAPSIDDLVLVDDGAKVGTLERAAARDDGAVAVELAAEGFGNVAREQAEGRRTRTVSIRRTVGILPPGEEVSQCFVRGFAAAYRLAKVDDVLLVDEHNLLSLLLA